jgi:transposase
MQKKNEPGTLKLRKRIYNFFLENRKRGKQFTFLHFRDEGVPRSTIYSIIQRVESGKSVERVPGSGRKAKIMTKKNIKALKLLFDHNDNVSQNQAARKFKCDQSYVCKHCKDTPK